MDIEIPAIPAGMLTLLSFFAPYAVAVVNRPEWSSRWKIVIAVAVSLLVSLLVIGLYYVQTGETVPDWPALLLLGLAVSQAAYSLLWSSVKNVEVASTSGA